MGLNTRLRPSPSPHLDHEQARLLRHQRIEMRFGALNAAELHRRLLRPASHFLRRRYEIDGRFASSPACRSFPIPRS
jgi:hypothetical protein